MTRDRADHCCPDCDNSDVFQQHGKVYECRRCGMEIHEAVASSVDTLGELADRDDKAGAYAERLLKTGGLNDA